MALCIFTDELPSRGAVASQSHGRRHAGLAIDDRLPATTSTQTSASRGKKRTPSTTRGPATKRPATDEPIPSTSTGITHSTPRRLPGDPLNSCPNCLVRGTGGALCKYSVLLAPCNKCHRRLAASGFSPDRPGRCQACVNTDKHRKRLTALLGAIVEYPMNTSLDDIDFREYFETHRDELN